MRERAGRAPAVGAAGTLRMLAIGATLSALWALSLWALSEVLNPAEWWDRAVLLATVATLLACLLAARLPERRALAVAIPAAAGAAIWIMGLIRSGSLLTWVTDPVGQWRGIQGEVLRGIAPVNPSLELQDLLLLVVWLWSIVVALVLTRGGGRRGGRGGGERSPAREPAGGVPHALSAALLIVLPTLAVPIAIHHRLGPAVVLGAGILIALVVWLASPRVRLAGGIAVGCAVALAAGVLAVVPDRPDRIWNEAIQVGPVGSYVDDVTIELARSLGVRSPASVFTYTASEQQPVYFRLASLSTFSGGTWLPDDEPDAAGREVWEQRSLVPATPGLPGTSLATVERLAAGERNGLGRLFVATPAGNALFAHEDGQLVGFEPASPEWQDLTFDAAANAGQRVDVTISGLRSSWLPLPTGTTRVGRASASMDLDDWVWAQQANTARASREMTETGDTFEAGVQPGGGVPPRAVLRALPPELLRVFPGGAGAPAELRQFLELPGELPQSLRDLKQSIEFAGLDRVSAASELEHYFRTSGRFTYDETAPFLPGADPADPYGVMDALLTTGAGFCVHFATTFAVVARSLGVPTRVAVGYASRSQGPTPVTVRALDLHAWPEIYVDTVGWVPFEPTPGGAGVRAESGSEGAADQGRPAASPEDELSGRNTPLPTERPDAADDDDAAGSGDTAAPGGGSQSSALGVFSEPWIAAAALLALALLLALVPALVRTLRRRRRRRAITRGPDPASAAWAELTDTLRDFGALPEYGGPDPARWPRARTPEAIAAALAAGGLLTSPDSLAGAASLAGAVAEERYAPASAAPAGERSRQRLAANLADCEAELRAAASRSARLRAALLPPSVLGRRRHRPSSR